jgi:hypothetical protein
VAATEKIPAGAEAAIMYTFVPHESFDSRDYGLTVLVDYEMVCALLMHCVYELAWFGKPFPDA